MNTSTIRTLTAQSGAALVTGLIFMVVLTLLVVSAMRGAILEERMSGNARDADLAFQAAEAALRAGEQVLNGATLPAFAATGAYLTVANRNDTYWLSTHGWAANSVAYPTGPNGVAAAPRYVLEELPAVAGAGFSKKAGAIPETGYYRVIARGVGGNLNTVRYIQTTYRR
ncbi:MAG TPA: PilX N-terminal domain-containing pilus assembly protein [Thiobacillus sp.]